MQILRGTQTNLHVWRPVYVISLHRQWSWLNTALNAVQCVSLTCASKWNYCKKTQNPSCFKTGFSSCCSGCFQLSSVVAEAFCTPPWLYVQNAERLFNTAYICIIIGSELCQLWAWALLQQLMKQQQQQEHALLTHDALRAWELFGLKLGILRAHLNWLGQQEMTSATSPGGCGLQA